MSRTTDTAVKLIIESDDDISSDLAPFIEAASSMVSQLCEPATDSDGDLIHDATSLELVERWLSAHFYAIRDNAPRTINERAGSVGAQYSSRIDLALNQTHWGQQAMLLDYSGELAKWNKDVTSGKGKRTATATWLGTEDD